MKSSKLCIHYKYILFEVQLTKYKEANEGGKQRWRYGGNNSNIKIIAGQ